MTETTRIPDDAKGTPQRNEWTVLRETAQVLYRGLRQDLGSGAFRLAPLPPLALTRLRRLPRPLRLALSRLPHAALAVLTLLTFAMSGSGEFGYPFEGLAAALPLVVALFRPVGAFWASTALVVVVAALSDRWDGAWPWTPGAFVSHLTVMALVALRARPSAAVWMWTITTVYAVSAESLTDRWSTDSWPMIVISAVVLTVAVALRGWRTAAQESVAKDVVTARERSHRTLLEERTTIARELHDVVAHHMSVVAIQAEAAPYRVQDPPPELTAAFATIRENAVAALAELRRVLGVVRSDDYEAPDAPQPTLADLDRLLENVREAGLPVDKAVTGAVRELPPGVELSAYRIIQEALSNTLRHAPGATARVELSYVLGGLGVRIVNTPPTREFEPSPGAGQGLTGMRERVTMLDGELSVEPLDGGGFEVTVFLPARRADEE